MDWIDSKVARRKRKASLKAKKTGDRTSLKKHITATLAQPTVVWAAALEHSYSGVKWPKGCALESIWCWSTVTKEQAEVLVRAGVSVRRMAGILEGAERPDDKARMSAVSGMMHEPLEQKLFEWLEQSDTQPDAALGLIAAMWHLPDHALRSDHQWIGRWVKSVADCMLERQDVPGDCLLGNLIFHCELPLLLELLTATPRYAAGDVASRAMDDLAEYLENSQQHRHAWLAQGATYLRAELGTVLRCRMLADHLGLRRWFPPQRRALTELLVCASRWARPDGSQLLSDGQSDPMGYGCWKALDQLASKKGKLRKTLGMSGLLDGKTAKPRAVNLDSQPSPSEHSEDARCASLRHSWTHRDCGLAVDFSERLIKLEALGPSGISLIKGIWHVDVSLDGQKLIPPNDWTENCWFSDSDVDYIEIEAKFGEMATVQRQLVLFRKQRFLLVGDALIGEVPGQWKMESALPLGSGVHVESVGKNTELLLTGHKCRSLVVPLFLPEWRSLPASGSIDFNSGRVMIQNSTQSDASRLYSPLVVCLANRPAHQSYTWRNLTVAENLLISSRDQAVGYRMQFGKHQYLIYRNLAQAVKRSLLGVHLTSDFYAGMIDHETGDVNSLVEVEAC